MLTSFRLSALATALLIPGIATAQAEAAKLFGEIMTESTPTAVGPGEYGATPDGGMNWGEGTPQGMIEQSQSPGGGGGGGGSSNLPGEPIILEDEH